MEKITLSVSDCIALVNQTLEYAYPVVVVEGEVASFKVSKGKYVFFDIKDDTGVLGCFMMVYQLRTPIEDGMKVKVVAQPRLTAWGKFSLNVREVAPVGEGNIKRSFELLRAKLAKEGLFDENRKRLLPLMPSRVGLIASVESAGYADFIKIMNQRWGGVEIVVADVQVQGVSAAPQIIRALDYFNQHSNPVDAIVMVRGGGSAEDLAIFNDEPLVRAVAGSRIVTLVGVGHEVDVSLCDMAADVRAATPSNAAQLLVPDKKATSKQLTYQLKHIVHKLEVQTKSIKERLRTDNTYMLAKIQHKLQLQQQHVGYIKQVLRQLDPKAVLARGYSLVRDKKGKIIKESPEVGDSLQIETATTFIQTGVTDVREK
jgi:exodeoxyribonuclease VII large subunit